MKDIIFGTMTWGRETGYDDAAECYDVAREHDIDTFDTAAIYGDGKAEKWLGEFAHLDRTIKVNTKVGYRGENPFEQSEQCCERLRRVPDIHNMGAQYHHKILKLCLFLVCSSGISS